MTVATACFAISAAVLAADLPADFTLPQPPGPHVAPPAEAVGTTGAFRAGQPVVATTYFYWYDAPSRAHVIDHDGTDALTDHPPSLEGFSYKNTDWHQRQLEEMMAAGIDVLLPVYWGDPLGGHAWSDEGLPPLVAARHRLLKAGDRPPAIGMFYDTSTLRHNAGGYHVDLTTGMIEFRAERNVTWDLQMTHYNGKKPLPSEIQSLLEHR